MAAKTPYDVLNPEQNIDEEISTIFGGGAETPMPPASAPMAKEQVGPPPEPMDMEPFQSRARVGQQSSGPMSFSVQKPQSKYTPFTAARVASQAAAEGIERAKAKKGLEQYLARGEQAAKKEYARLINIFGDEARDWIPPTDAFYDEKGVFQPYKHLQAMGIGADKYWKHKQEVDKQEMERLKYEAERKEKEYARNKDAGTLDWQMEQRRQVQETIAREKGMPKPPSSVETGEAYLAQSGQLSEFAEQHVKLKQNREQNVANASRNMTSQELSNLNMLNAAANSALSRFSTYDTKVQNATKSVAAAQEKVASFENSVADVKANGKLLPSVYTPEKIAAEEAKLEGARKSLNSAINELTKAQDQAAEQQEKVRETDAAVNAFVFDKAATAKQALKTGMSTDGTGKKPVTINGVATPEATAARRKYESMGYTQEQVKSAMARDGFDIK